MRCKPCGRPSACKKLYWWELRPAVSIQPLCRPRRTSAPWCCMVSKTTPCPWPACSIRAGPRVLPVTVVPGGEHFFHGQLPLLKSLVLRHLLSPVL